MALNSGIVWEVRTTGNINNGGGYKTGASGTDFSQQDAAQYSLTGVTTAGADAVLLTASAAANMVGNIANITGGTNFTTGRYEITSVSVGVSITLDRTCTTAAGALGTVEIGGAVDHPNTISAILVTGNTVYIKSGTYSAVGANDYVLTVTIIGCNYVGYHTDRTKLNKDSTRTILDGGSSVTNALLYTANVDGSRFYNLVFQNATADGALGSNLVSDVEFQNCKFATNGDDGVSGFLNPQFLMCEANNNTAIGFNNGADYLFCYTHDNGGIGISAFNGNVSFSIADSNSSNGIDFDHSAWIINNVAYNNTGATTDGFQFNTNTNTAPSFVINNIASANGRYGFNQASGSKITHFDYNCTYGNGTSGTNGIDSTLTGANNITTDPGFNNPGSGDFSVTGTAVDAGFPAHSMAGATV